MCKGCVHNPCHPKTFTMASCKYAAIQLPAPPFPPLKKTWTKTHQLRLVVYPIIPRVLYHIYIYMCINPRWFSRRISEPYKYVRNHRLNDVLNTHESAKLMLTGWFCSARKALTATWGTLPGGFLPMPFIYRAIAHAPGNPFYIAQTRASENGNEDAKNTMARFGEICGCETLRSHQDDMDGDRRSLTDLHFWRLHPCFFAAWKLE